MRFVFVYQIFVCISFLKITIKCLVQDLSKSRHVIMTSHLMLNFKNLSKKLFDSELFSLVETGT